MKRFELAEGASNKFWEIDLDGPSFTVRWGKIGTSGQRQTKSFGSPGEARAAHAKLVAEKLKKGYSAIGRSRTRGKAPERTPRAAGSASMPRWKRDRLEWARAHRTRGLDAALASLTPQEIRALSRDAVIARLRTVRDAWEALTGRNQDLSDERLASESAREVQGHLTWYASDEARALLADYLLDLVKDLTRPARA